MKTIVEKQLRVEDDEPKMEQYKILVGFIVKRI